jgi:hypothetical protein
MVELNDQQFASFMRGEPTSDLEEKKARMAAANSPDYHSRRLALKNKAVGKRIANTGA